MKEHLVTALHSIEQNFPNAKKPLISSDNISRADLQNYENRLHDNVEDTASKE